LVEESAGVQPEDQQDVQERLGAGVGEPQPGGAGSVGVDDRVAGGVQGFGAGDGVVAESLDAKQAPVGGVADLPQRGQVGQPFAQAEVHGLVDDGLGAKRPPQLVVLLDLGVLVEHVQARGDPVGDHAGGKDAGSVVLAATVDGPAEDQADAVGPAQVKVVADD